MKVPKRLEGLALLPRRRHCCSKELSKTTKSIICLTNKKKLPNKPTPIKQLPSYLAPFNYIVIEIQEVCLLCEVAFPRRESHSSNNRTN